MDDALKSSVHFYTLAQMGYEESNSAVTFYHDRTHFDPNKRNLYAQFAEEFSLQQGRQFVLHNRLATTPSKMSRLKDQVKELDEFLQNPANNIIKLMWLSPNRPLMSFDNATFLWMLIDAASGDLTKCCLDSSLREIKLSGKRISDFEFFVSPNVMMVAVYSDSNRVDFLGFGKAALFEAFLNLREAAPDKFSLFEPTLIRSIDLQCPSTFEVEKRLLVCFKSNKRVTPNLTVWWSNQSASRPEDQSLSLLERNDLRTNVVVLSPNLTGPDSNLFEYLAKSDGCLLSLSYMNDDPKALVAVEQTEMVPSGQFSIDIYRHSIYGETGDEAAAPKSRPKQKLASIIVNSRLTSSKQIKPSKRFIAMVTTDETLIIFDVNRNVFLQSKLDSDKNSLLRSIEWLVDDLLFCLFNSSGRLRIFDVALNPIESVYATRFEPRFDSISTYLNEKLAKNNKFKSLVCSKTISFDCLWCLFAFSNGPVGLYSVRLPANFNCIALMAHYLKNSQTDGLQDRYLGAASRLLTQMDWDRDGYAALTCFYKLMNFVLNSDVPNDSDGSKKEAYCQTALSTFYSPVSALKPSTIRTFRHPISRYARRFFFMLVSKGSLETAYRLAIDLNSPDLFVDLYHCALEKDESTMAHLCAERARQSGTGLDRASINENLDGIAVLERDLDEISDSDDETTNESTKRGIFKGNLRKSKIDFRPYTEHDIEEYAKQVWNKNRFLLDLKRDQF